MSSRTVQTTSAEATERLGAELAERLRPGDIVLIRGELGAGKTTFVRGAARALGVEDPVTSPTFSIGHRYRGARASVAHLDFYRLAALEGEEPDLLYDYLAPDSIAFVEWPPREAPELSLAAVAVSIEHGGGDARRFRIDERSSGQAALQPTADDSVAATVAAATTTSGPATGSAAVRPQQGRDSDPTAR